MDTRKSFLLRLSPEMMEALNRWAKDELRSVNAQIEYILRDSLRRQKRHVKDVGNAPPASDSDSDSEKP